LVQTFIFQVYQPAMESQNKELITIYQLNSETDDDSNNGLGDRDVLVEIVSGQDDNLLQGTATLAADGTFILGSHGEDGSLQVKKINWKHLLKHI